MRLVGDFDSEKEVYLLYALLNKEGIQSTYESIVDPNTGVQHFRIWVYEEGDLDRAIDCIKRFRENPNAFEGVESHTPSPPPPPSGIGEKNIQSAISSPDSAKFKWKIKVELRPPATRLSFTLTNFFLVVCVFLFFWNSIQEKKIVEEKGVLALEIGLAPLERALLFDYTAPFECIDKLLTVDSLKDYKTFKEVPPATMALYEQAEAIPAWNGVYGILLSSKNKKMPKSTFDVPLFEKIRQGEVWRLFTPALLHRDFLHILFNMAWLWILGRQIEERAGKWRMLLMIFIIAIISNVAQYLMNGPYFLGFSGVVVGMVGYIWVRQKNAPWEGYPLQRTTLIFLLVFVAAMFGIECVSFFLQLFSVTTLSPNIANTAHIVGGLIGMLLAKIPFFARGVS